jgi:hypothetical protein
VRLFLRQPLRRGEVLGNADGFPLRRVAISFAKALLDQADGEVCDVDPDPLPSQLLRRVDRRPAAAERVKHNIARI